MKELIKIIIIGISLSMDTFSLSLIYGTLNIKKRDTKLLAMIVGIYHFIMPLIGFYLGGVVLERILIDKNIIISIILLILGIGMISSINKQNKKLSILKTGGMLLFGVTVSFDSFSVGMVMDYIDDRHVTAAFIFALISATFTYIGLYFGTKLNKNFGKYSVLAGGIILIILGITYLFK